MKHFAILVVENDLQLQELLVNTLSGLGKCLGSCSLAETYRLLESNRFDLVVLDRMLDDGDSLELLPFLKELSFNTRTIMLTSRNLLKDILEGLQTGADDYLPKPFSAAELRLRVQSLLNKQKTHATHTTVVGNIEIQHNQGTIVIHNRPFRLRKREMQIMSCLALYQNQVVSRSTLISHVWSGQDEIPQHASLDVYIRRLRIQVPELRSCIQTIRGFGYRLVSLN